MVKILSFVLFFFSGFFIQAALPVKINAENLLTQKTESVSTQNSDKKGLVVVFLSAKCPCSNSHMQLLKDMAAKYTQFQFLGLHSNTNEPVELSRKYFKDSQMPFMILQDEKNQLADLFKANKTPHAFVVSPAGEIVYKGGITNSANAPSADRNLLAEALDDISENRTVRTSAGRALGCAIIREGDDK